MEKQINIQAIQQALDSGMNTNITKVLIPSLGRKVPFKPLTTVQCKTLAKMFIDSNENAFETFNNTLGLIKATCLDKSLDMNMLTELDRIKLVIEFYRSNNILKDFNIDCPHCGKKTLVKINLDKTIEQIESFDTTPIEFDNGQPNKMTCTIEVPKLTTMYRFYEKVQAGDLSMDDDLMKCFISQFDVVFENSEVAPISISINDGEIDEFSKVIDMLPYNLMTNDTTKKYVFDLILERVEAMMSSADVTQICDHCHEELEDIASARNFT